MTIEPEIAAFVAETERFFPPEAGSRGIEGQRELYETYARAFGLSRPPGIAVEDGAVALEGRSVPVRLYRPAGTAPRGTIVYAHGGGFILGSLDSHDGIVARIAATTGAAVMAVDYRLAPEHPYPAGHADVLGAVEALRDGLSPWPDLAREPLVLCGDSAGGTLVASAALRIAGRVKREGRAPIAGLALAYPALGFEPAAPARDTEAEAPMLTLDEVRQYRAAYLSGVAPEPWAFPLDASSLDGMPPTTMLAAEHDPLRDDCVLFAERLRGAGVSAECVIGPGLVHGFLRAVDRSPAAAEAFGRWASFMAERLKP